MEELKAMFKVCRHIKTNGIRCGSPAITGMNFCFNHFTGKPMAFVRASTTTTYETNLAFLHPGTREAIQHNLALVAQALNEGKIDTQTANAYTRLYRVAEQNLTRWEKAHKNNPEKQMLPLSSEEEDVILNEAQRSEGPAVKEEDVILNEAQRSEGPAVSGLVSGHGFSP